jgi:hypothetical protein
MMSPKVEQDLQQELLKIEAHTEKQKEFLERNVSSNTKTQQSYQYCCGCYLLAYLTLCYSDVIQAVVVNMCWLYRFQISAACVYT